MIWPRAIGPRTVLISLAVAGLVMARPMGGIALAVDAPVAAPPALPNPPITPPFQDPTNPPGPAVVTTVPAYLLPDSALMPDAPAPAGVPSMPDATLDAGANNTRLQKSYQKRFEMARYLRFTRQPADAMPILIELLTQDAPEPIKQNAMLELALAAQDQNDLSRAEQIYAQFLSRWSNDPRVPELLLRQGRLFREMGLNTLALAKFYSVMTSALVLKNDRLDYYQRLVLQAQTEIAETHYQLGRYADAADFFRRLLKQNNPLLDRSTVQFRLIRSLSALEQNDETVAQAQEFLERYGDQPEQPEVRFYLSLALKHLGRNNESLQQVLTLLREERERTKGHPELWAYWQQRTGNEIANQLYREGDFTRALEIYLGLVGLDSSPGWQMPVQYQIGMTYERLMQPQKAVAAYNAILAAGATLGTNAAPSQKEVMDMARWRADFIGWQDKAEDVNRRLALPQTTNSTTTVTNVSLPVACNE
jgi:tetratricopeptide (TPR) repeat protein